MKEITINKCNLQLHNADYKDILKSIKKESIPLCVSDPPYGINYSNAHSEKIKQDWDKFTSQEYITFMTDWFNEVYNILIPNGTCWFFYGFTRIKEILQSIDNTKFINNLENHLVYARSKGRASKNKLKSLREECGMLTKTKNYTWNTEEYLRRVIAPYREKGGAKRGWDTHPDSNLPARFTGLGNVIPIFTSLSEEVAEDRRGVVLDIGSGERLPLSGDIYNLQFPVVPSVLNTMEKQVHSAQKAILILCMLILLSSKEGDTVIDCFGGSFSTGIACAITGRNFIGIEKDKNTFKKGIEHIQNTPFEKWEKYIKSHLSTSEPGKFSFGNRSIMKK